MTHRRLPIAMFVLLSSLPALAASFDCKLAKSPREKTVCADQKLSAMDSAMAEAYTKLRAQLSPEGVTDVRAGQRAWLTFVDHVCLPNGKGSRANITECLTQEYATRNRDLTTVDKLASRHVLYAHTVYVVKPQTKSLGDSSSSDPGFGVGEFSYPQIDRPSPSETAFNVAIKLFALNSLSDARKRHTSFTQAVDPFGEVYLSYTLRGDNDRLIATDFTLMTYGYGAAHPLSSVLTLSYWLDQHRVLTADDVFRSNSGWNTALAQPILAKLRADKDVHEYILEDDAPKGIRTELETPQQWIVSREGLTFRFAQYQVTAYVAGMPMVGFTWDELKPYLNPALHPESLPVLRKAANE